MVGFLRRKPQGLLPRWALAVLLGLLLAACNRGESILPGKYRGRPFVLYSPKGLAPESKAPLLYVFHAYATAPHVQAKFFKAFAEAEARGFRVVIPKGRSDSAEHLFWNATDACCDWDRTGVDELPYLDEVHKDVLARVAVDESRVYGVGVSNGAFMARALACARPTRFAALALVAGGASAGACEGSPPTLVVHGDADETVRFDGGVMGDLAPYPSAVSLLGSSQDSVTVESPEWSVDGRRVSVLRRGSSSQVWRVHGGGHGLKLGDDGRRRLFEFLLAQARAPEHSKVP